MPSKIKAILFDLDGTLRDSREMIYPALEHALDKHLGQAPSREAMRPFIHHHDHVYEEFAASIDKEAFMESYWEKIEELRPSMQPYKGAHDALGNYKANGYKLGIVTSASTAANYLKQHKIEELFDVVVNGNDVTEHKPSPMPVIRALELLQIKPNEAVMIGDLPADIAAAQAAKLRATIGITHGFGMREELEAAGADFIIDSIDELQACLDKVNH